MKRNIFYFIFILTINGISYAQLPLTYGVRTTMDLYETNKLVSGNNSSILTEKDIDGSPYLNDEFFKGTIYTVQKLKYIDIPLRYNIYNDNLEFKTPTNEIQALVTPEIVEKAIIGEIQLEYLHYIKSNKTNKGFLILLEEGKVSLFSKPEVVFKEATEPAAYKQAEPARFVRKTETCFMRIGNEPARLITNKKELISLFPNDQEKIESFIVKKKLKINKPEDLRKVVVFYNSLYL